jgi:hypothetical protein
METSGQLQVPAVLLLVKDSRVPIEEGSGWALGPFIIYQVLVHSSLKVMNNFFINLEISQNIYYILGFGVFESSVGVTFSNLIVTDISRIYPSLLLT